MVASPPREGVKAAHDHLIDTASEIKPRLRGWLHAATTLLAFVSFLVMLVLADDTLIRAGVAVFMTSALLLFGTSAIYHIKTWSPQRMIVLKRVDHANIFVLIAGSSTPFAILLLPEQHAVQLILVMWCGAALGVVFKIFWLDAPRWFHVPLYLLLGWAPVFFAAEFLNSAQHAPLILLAAGGVLYSIGALVYIFKWPDPSPQFFGFHEVFHSMTIAAFGVHYIGVSLLVYG